MSFSDSLSNSLRSFLFVPGDQPRKIEKSWQAEADCVILDLEDAVAPNERATARRTVAEKLAALPPRVPPMLVRINGDPAMWSEDLKVAIHPGLFGVIVPKCASTSELTQLDCMLQFAEQQRVISCRPIRLFLLIESARGLLALPSLLPVSNRTAGIVLGAEDLCLDMGMARTRSGGELGYARWLVSLNARANGLAAIDAVFSDFSDAEGLALDARTARGMGFTGKLAIHPRQIEPIHLAFSPTEAEVAEARLIIEAFNRALAEGKGAIAFEGKMLDEPIIQRARQILRRAEIIYPGPSQVGSTRV